MTIEEKRINIQNKLIGAESLYRTFSGITHFLCGCSVMGLFPIWEVFSTRMIVTIGCLCFAYVSQLIAKLFKSVKEDALKEIKELSSLSQWMFNNN